MPAPGSVRLQLRPPSQYFHWTFLLAYFIRVHPCPKGLAFLPCASQLRVALRFTCMPPLPSAHYPLHIMTRVIFLLPPCFKILFITCILPLLLPFLLPFLLPLLLPLLVAVCYRAEGVRYNSPHRGLPETMRRGGQQNDVFDRKKERGSHRVSFKHT